MILLYTTKFRVNLIITRWDIAKTRFSIWRPSAILNFQNFGILLSIRSCKSNPHLPTKFHLNLLISGWYIAIKPFSNWRPSAILNFRNLVFWSYDLYYNVILLYPTKFRINRIITGWDIAKRRFSIWRPSAILNLQNFGILLCSRPWKHNLHLHIKLPWNRMISKAIFNMAALRHIGFAVTSSYCIRILDTLFLTLC